MSEPPWAKKVGQVLRCSQDFSLDNWELAAGERANLAALKRLRKPPKTDRDQSTKEVVLENFLFCLGKTQQKHLLHQSIHG
jgi:hypothetical protein